MGTQCDDPHLEDGLLDQSENSKLYTADGSVDREGKPVLKTGTGNWKACPFILGNECCERLVYFAIAHNLVNYLTTRLHEGNASAARSVSTWAGTCYITPLIGAFLADAYWGRYWTITIFSVIYFIGMCILTLSASVPAFKPADCVDLSCPSLAPLQYNILFSGLYLIALGAGGIKPCVSSFGADQFDDTDPKERVTKGSFFNWYFFSINLGSFLSSSIIIWIQENVGWDVGFGIPAVFMGISIATFLAGTPLYRFQRPRGSPLTRVCQVVVASWGKRALAVPKDCSLLYETKDGDLAIKESKKLEHTGEFEYLDKAAIYSDHEKRSVILYDPWRLCPVTQVEELKILIRMFPIWATGIVFAAVYSQTSTMFIEQGMMMNRSIGSFRIPAGSLSVFNNISVIIWVPVYDRILVPLARKYTGKEKGFSELQRMGIGLCISILAVVAAATLETKRLQLAEELGLVDENVAVPLNVLWQVPQFFLVGAADVFTFIGQLQFFYDQSPENMRSLCTAFSLLSISLGSYLSSFIITVVTYVTTKGGNPGWIPNNLNKGHLNYFFWLLAGLSSVNLVLYAYYARAFKQKKVL